MFHNNIDYRTFALLRTRSKFLIASDYREYVASVEDSIAGDPSRVWSFVMCRRRGASRAPGVLRFGDAVAADGAAIAELFGSYFSSVFVDGRPVDDSVEPEVCALNVPTLFTISDIVNSLRSLAASAGAGPDGLPGSFLRGCAEGLAVPLHILFTRSLGESRFPMVWKKAHVIPIFKSGNRELAQNYRPISILSSLSKVFESLIYKSIMFEVKNRIIPQQHGFFPGRSVDTNLCTYTEFILNSLDARTQVDAVYTDFSKAFDKIDHAILVSKLEAIRLDKFLVRWLTSYITNRSQAVRVSNFVSAYRRIPSGVAQGSHIGPLLFSIYINDISSCFNRSEFLMYADDTKIFSKVTSTQDCHEFQADLDNFHQYCVTNKLVLNYNKCHKITFARNRYTFDKDYKLGENVISSVDSIKDLGVVVDSKLLFDMHVRHCTQRAYRGLGFILRLSSDFSSLSAINALYYAYVNSVLSFASVVWNPQYQVYNDQLEAIQKRYVKYLSRRFCLPACPYETRCTVFGLVPLWARRRVQDAVFLYKIINGLLDAPALLCLLMFNVPDRLSRASRLFRLPLCHTNAYQNSPINRIVASYNRLFSHIDPFASSIASFKRQLKSPSVTAL